MVSGPEMALCNMVGGVNLTKSTKLSGDEERLWKPLRLGATVAAEQSISDSAGRPEHGLQGPEGRRFRNFRRRKGCGRLPAVVGQRYFLHDHDSVVKSALGWHVAERYPGDKHEALRSSRVMDTG